jgi:arylformamidase
MKQRLYDISQPVRTGIPVWPGDSPFQLAWPLRRAQGASVNLSTLHLSAHTGTHADAPFHASDTGSRIGGMPLEPFLGLALLVDARGWESISAARVAPILERERPVRLLFRTGCWVDPRLFPTTFPPLEPAAVSLLAQFGLRLVGTDAPSVDPFDSTTLPAHNALLSSGIANLENLVLDEVPPGRYELIALPLRLEEACASPVRAVLREP